MIIPKVKHQQVLGGMNIEIYDTKTTDVFLCQVDNDLKYLSSFDIRGFVIKKILLQNM